MHSTMGLRVFPFFFCEISSLTDVSLFININYRSVQSMGKAWKKYRGKKNNKAFVASRGCEYIFFIPCVTDTHFTPKSKYITTNENYYFPRGTGI